MSTSNYTSDLDGQIRIFIGQLYNHDYLWFSSTEISQLSTTLPYLHNYAMSYALTQFQRGIIFGSTPTYDSDLEQMSLYTTPAASLSSSETTTFMFNAVDEKTLKTDHKLSVNAPKLGWRTCLDPIYENNKSTPSRGYTIYSFVYNGEYPRSVIRLGKKGCPVRIRWQEINKPTAVWSDVPVRPSHPVNPLDVSGRIVRFDPIALPPHLLMRVADIQHDWFIRRGRHTIHLPKRVTVKLGLKILEKD